MPDRSARLRKAYAASIARSAGVADPAHRGRLRRGSARGLFRPAALACVRRRVRLGERDATSPRSTTTSSSPSTPSRGINNGQPSLHAASIEALAIAEGETVLQIGAGAGYYTAILAHLVGPAGKVIAYEIEPDIAGRARENLACFPAGRGPRVVRGGRGPAEGRRDLCQLRGVPPAARLARRAQSRRPAAVPASGGAFDRRHAAHHPPEGRTASAWPARSSSAGSSSSPARARRTRRRAAGSTKPSAAAARMRCAGCGSAPAPRGGRLAAGRRLGADDVGGLELGLSARRRQTRRNLVQPGAALADGRSAEPKARPRSLSPRRAARPATGDGRRPRLGQAFSVFAVAPDGAAGTTCLATAEPTKSVQYQYFTIKLDESNMHK